MTEEIAAIIESLQLLADNCTGQLAHAVYFALDFITARCNEAEDFREQAEETTRIHRVFGFRTNVPVEEEV